MQIKSEIVRNIFNYSFSAVQPSIRMSSYDNYSIVILNGPSQDVNKCMFYALCVPQIITNSRSSNGSILQIGDYDSDIDFQGEISSLQMSSLNEHILSGNNVCNTLFNLLDISSTEEINILEAHDNAIELFPSLSLSNIRISNYILILVYVSGNHYISLLLDDRNSTIYFYDSSVSSFESYMRYGSTLLRGIEQVTDRPGFTRIRFNFLSLKQMNLSANIHFVETSTSTELMPSILRINYTDAVMSDVMSLDYFETSKRIRPYEASTRSQRVLLVTDKELFMDSLTSVVAVLRHGVCYRQKVTQTLQPSPVDITTCHRNKSSCHNFAKLLNKVYKPNWIHCIDYVDNFNINSIKTSVREMITSLPASYWASTENMLFALTDGKTGSIGFTYSRPLDSLIMSMESTGSSDDLLKHLLNLIRFWSEQYIITRVSDSTVSPDLKLCSFEYDPKWATNPIVHYSQRYKLGDDQLLEYAQIPIYKLSKKRTNAESQLTSEQRSLDIIATYKTKIAAKKATIKKLQITEESFKTLLMRSNEDIVSGPDAEVQSNNKLQALYDKRHNIIQEFVMSLDNDLIDNYLKDPRVSKIKDDSDLLSETVLDYFSEHDIRINAMLDELENDRLLSNWVALRPDRTVYNNDTVTLIEFSVCTSASGIEDRFQEKSKYRRVVSILNKYASDRFDVVTVLYCVQNGSFYINSTQNRRRINVLAIETVQQQIMDLTSRMTAAKVVVRRGKDEEPDDIYELAFDENLANEIDDLDKSLNGFDKFEELPDLNRRLIDLIMSPQLDKYDVYPKNNTMLEISVAKNQMFIDLSTEKTDDDGHGYVFSHNGAKTSFILPCIDTRERYDEEKLCSGFDSYVARLRQFSNQYNNEHYLLSVMSALISSVGSKPGSAIELPQIIIEVMKNFNKTESSNFYEGPNTITKPTPESRLTGFTVTRRKTVELHSERSRKFKENSFYEEAHINMTKKQKEDSKRKRFDEGEYEFIRVDDDRYHQSVEKMIAILVSEEKESLRYHVPEQFYFKSKNADSSTDLHFNQSSDRSVEIVSNLTRIKLYGWLIMYHKLFRQLSSEAAFTNRASEVTVGTGGCSNVVWYMLSGNQAEKRDGSRPFFFVYRVDSLTLNFIENSHLFPIKETHRIPGSDKYLVVSKMMRLKIEQLMQKDDVYTRILGDLYSKHQLYKDNHAVIARMSAIHAIIGLSCSANLMRIVKNCQYALLSSISLFSRTASIFKKKFKIRCKTAVEVYFLRTIANYMIGLSSMKEKSISDSESGSEVFEGNDEVYQNYGAKIEIYSEFAQCTLTDFEAFLSDCYIYHFGVRETTVYRHSITQVLNAVIDANEDFLKEYGYDWSKPGVDCDPRVLSTSGMTEDQIFEQAERCLSLDNKFSCSEYFVNHAVTVFKRRRVVGKEHNIRRAIATSSIENKPLMILMSTRSCLPENKTIDKPRVKVHDAIIEAYEKYGKSITIGQYVGQRLKGKSLKEMKAEFEIALRVQFGDDREVYITDLLHKTLLRITEDVFRAINGTYEEEFISTSGVQKTMILEQQNKTIYTKVKENPNLFTFFMNMDRSKWSLMAMVRVMEITVSHFKYLIPKNLYRIIRLTLYMNRRKTLRLNRDIYESFQKYKKEGIPMSERVRMVMDKLDEGTLSELEISVGWFQGMFNNLSSLIHVITAEYGNYLIDEVKILGGFKDVTRLYCRHSDDANDALVLRNYDDAARIIALDRIACLLFGIKDSPMKSFYMFFIREFLSELYLKGRSAIPWIKFLSIFQRASGFGLSLDVGELLGKIQNVYTKGATEEHCNYLTRLVHMITESVYRTGAGHTNDITKIFKNFDRDEIPFEFGGRVIVNWLHSLFNGLMDNNMRIYEKSEKCRRFIQFVRHFVPSYDENPGAFSIADLKEGTVGTMSGEVQFNISDSVSSYILPSPLNAVFWDSRIGDIRKKYEAIKESHLDKYLDDSIFAVLTPMSGEEPYYYMLSKYFTYQYTITYSRFSAFQSMLRLMKSINGKIIKVGPEIRMSFRDYYTAMNSFFEEFIRIESLTVVEKESTRKNKEVVMRVFSEDCYSLLSRSSPAIRFIKDSVTIEEGFQNRKSRIMMTQEIPTKTITIRFDNPPEFIALFIKEGLEGLTKRNVKPPRILLLADDAEQAEKYVGEDQLKELTIVEIYQILSRIRSRRRFIRTVMFKKGDLANFIFHSVADQSRDGKTLAVRMKNAPLVSTFTGMNLSTGVSPAVQMAIDYFVALYLSQCYLIYHDKRSDYRDLIAKELRTEQAISHIDMLNSDVNVSEAAMKQLLIGDKLYKLCSFMLSYGILRPLCCTILSEMRPLSRDYGEGAQKKRNGVYYGRGYVNIYGSGCSLVYYLDDDHRRYILLKLPTNRNFIAIPLLNKMISFGFSSLEQANSPVKDFQLRSDVNVFLHNGLRDEMPSRPDGRLSVNYTTGYVEEVKDTTYKCLRVVFEYRVPRSDHQPVTSAVTATAMERLMMIQSARPTSREAINSKYKINVSRQIATGVQLPPRLDSLKSVIDKDNRNRVYMLNGQVDRPPVVMSPFRYQFANTFKSSFLRCCDGKVDPFYITTKKLFIPSTVIPPSSRILSGNSHLANIKLEIASKYYFSHAAGVNDMKNLIEKYARKWLQTLNAKAEKKMSDTRSQMSTGSRAGSIKSNMSFASSFGSAFDMDHYDIYDDLEVDEPVVIEDIDDFEAVAPPVYEYTNIDRICEKSLLEELIRETMVRFTRAKSATSSDCHLMIAKLQELRVVTDVDQLEIIQARFNKYPILKEVISEYLSLITRCLKHTKAQVIIKKILLGMHPETSGDNILAKDLFAYDEDQEEDEDEDDDDDDTMDLDDLENERMNL